MTNPVCSCPNVAPSNGGGFICAEHGRVRGYRKLNNRESLRELANSQGLGWVKLLASTSIDCIECGAVLRKNDEMYLAPDGRICCDLCTPLSVIRETE